jgi:hypothetical protein
LIEIIRPILEAANYSVARADELPEPGLITEQVINSTIDSDLVIADLTNYNPNAFYELAIRHMAEKPVIHMLQEGSTPPFDVHNYRVIFYKITHPDDLKTARTNLKKQLDAVEASGFTVSNPITNARGHQKLAESGDSKDKMIATLLSRVGSHDAILSAIRSEILKLSALLPSPRPPSYLEWVLMNGPSAPIPSTSFTISGEPGPIGLLDPKNFGRLSVEDRPQVESKSTATASKEGSAGPTKK